MSIQILFKFISNVFAHSSSAKYFQRWDAWPKHLELAPVFFKCLMQLCQLFNVIQLLGL